jgi:hypothetical protein
MHHADIQLCIFNDTFPTLSNNRYHSIGGFSRFIYAHLAGVIDFTKRFKEEEDLHKDRVLDHVRWSSPRKRFNWASLMSVDRVQQVNF